MSLLYNLQPFLIWQATWTSSAMQWYWTEMNHLEFLHNVLIICSWHHQDRAVALCAHIEFDETGQKMQLRHELASTTTSMGVLESWSVKFWLHSTFQFQKGTYQSMPCAVCHTCPVGPFFHMLALTLWFTAWFHTYYSVSSVHINIHIRLDLYLPPCFKHVGMGAWGY